MQEKATSQTVPNLPGRIDSHIHTYLCNHAVGSMEEYVKSAVKKNLHHIFFLEHMEDGISGSRRTWLTETEFDIYFEEGARLQKKYLGQIKIGLGVECGYNPVCKENLLRRLSWRHWDKIGVSCHFLWIEEEQQHLNLFSRKKENLQLAGKLDLDTILSRYFDTLLEAVTVLPGTMLCHLDGVLRFLGDIQLSKTHLSQIVAVLDMAKKNDMILEMNSSGYAIRGEQFPTTAIITMAKALAIPLCMSSDAHRPEDVGQHFDKLSALL